MDNPTTSIASQGPTTLPTALTEAYVSPAAQRYLSMRAEATGGAPPAQPAPPQSGQGGGDGGGTAGGDGGGFNWNLFPDVPEEQRSLLEPHLRGVQGHVTKLEQQYAPWKGVLDSGLDSQSVMNLIALNQAINDNPVEAFLRLGRSLQEAEALSGDLDFDAVQQILNGEEAVEPGAGPAGDGEEIPPWAQRLIDAEERRSTQEQQTTQQQEAQQRQEMLNQTVTGIKGQLKEAGWDEADLDDDLIVSAILTHKGDADKAFAMVNEIRNKVLKGFTSQNGGSGGANELEMPDGPPEGSKPAGRGPRSEWASARKSAEQNLKRRNAAQAQG